MWAHAHQANPTPWLAGSQLQDDYQNEYWWENACTTDSSMAVDQQCVPHCPEPSIQSQIPSNRMMVQMHGLPSCCRVQDVLAFFAVHEVTECIDDCPGPVQLVPDGVGACCNATVAIRCEQDAEMVRARLHGQRMMTNHIQVTICRPELPS